MNKINNKIERLQREIKNVSSLIEKDVNTIHLLSDLMPKKIKENKEIKKARLKKLDNILKHTLNSLMEIRKYVKETTFNFLNEELSKLTDKELIELKDKIFNHKL